jgi:pimeloyl-ACP methyl ester carboxylesterase
MLSRRTPESAYGGDRLTLSQLWKLYRGRHFLSLKEQVERGEKLPVIIWVHPISNARGYRAAYRRDHPTYLANLRPEGYAVFAFDQIGHGSAD